VDPDDRTINHISASSPSVWGRSITAACSSPVALADKDGFRTDVVAAIKELRPSIFDGQEENFASGITGATDRARLNGRTYELAWGNRETTLSGRGISNSSGGVPTLPEHQLFDGDLG